MKTAAGELYFIGELDPRTRKPTPFTKIGLVRETRASTSRLSDHQTGNPRELFIHDVLTTPLVERVETLMHGLRATSRVGGEWFVLDENELADAIAEAKGHVRRAKKVVASVEAANELARQTSSTKQLPESPGSRKLVKRRLEIQTQEKAAARIEKTVKEAYRALHDRSVDLGGYFAVQRKSASQFFDEAALREEHPKIWRKFLVTQESVRGRFVWATDRKPILDVAQVNPALEEAERHITAAATKAKGPGKALDELHRLWLESLVLSADVAWQSEIVNVQARELCGRSTGIDGLCTWKRTSVTEEKFDRAAFRAERPELHDAFMSTRSSTEANVVARDRGYRL